MDGLRERVEVLGGELDASRVVSGWVLRAGPHWEVEVTDELTVLLVDDEPMVRHGLRAILESEPDITVVGEAADGAEAVASVRRHRPDVVGMDIRMPDVDGIRATERILALDDPPRGLVVTTFGSDDHVFSALRAGASGFLLKRSSADAIVTAVRTAVVLANQTGLVPLHPER